MYCNVCNKYRKFKKSEILYIFEKTLSLFIVYSKCGHEYKKIFKEETSKIEIEILIIISLINNLEEYQKNI